MAKPIRHGIMHKKTFIARKLETYKFLLHFNGLLGYFVAVCQLNFCSIRGQYNSRHLLDGDIFRVYQISETGSQAYTSGTRIEVRARNTSSINKQHSTFVKTDSQIYRNSS